MHVDPDKCVAIQEDVDHSDIYDLEKLAGLFEKHFGTGKKGGEKKVIKEVPGIEDKIEENKKEEEAKKKKKKIHYPKGYDPENPGPLPDPERWLPKWQRSKYRKKHGGASLLRGPQGGFQDAKTSINILIILRIRSSGGSGSGKNKIWEEKKCLSLFQEIAGILILERALSISLFLYP